MQIAGFIQVQQYRGNFQQCIRLGIETAGLDIDDDRQKTPKAAGDSSIGISFTHGDR